VGIKDVKLFNGILEHQAALEHGPTTELVLKAMAEMPVLIGLYNGTYRALQQKLTDSDTLIRASAEGIRLREAALRDFIATVLARSIAVGVQVGAEYGHTAALGQMGGGSLEDPEDILPSIY
jgi:hypothetical protein